MGVLTHSNDRFFVKSPKIIADEREKEKASSFPVMRNKQEYPAMLNVPVGQHTIVTLEHNSLVLL